MVCKDEQQIGEDQVSEALGSLISGQDPGIKLFGRVISALNGSENEDEGDLSICNNQESLHPPKGVQEHDGDEDHASACVSEEFGSSSGSFSGWEDEKTAGEDLAKVCALAAPLEISREQQAVKCSEEIALKKPDKPVPCPRCDSLDTKFCYFNNYNVNQPRHFCKQCQRYWTAGGSLRNVPVGAGRRKHKHSVEQQPQNQQPAAFECITVPQNEGDSAQQATVPADRSINSRAASTSTVTALNQDASPPQNISSNMKNDRSSSAFQSSNAASLTAQARAATQAKAAGAEAAKITEERFSAPPVSASPQMNIKGREHADQSSKPAMLTSIPSAPYGFFNGAWPSPYLFNPGWSAFLQPQAVAPFYHPSAGSVPPSQMLVGFPWCHPTVWPPGGWTSLPPTLWNPAMQWEAAAAAVAAAAAAAAPSPAVSSGNSNLGNSNLGKHPRDNQGLPESQIKGPLWLPKTLRMDDQAEHVRSSILASLGLSEVSSSHLTVSQKDMHKSFVAEFAAVAAGEARHENPAATTRSIAFQESN